jgi:hypothetical protein
MSFLAIMLRAGEKNMALMIGLALCILFALMYVEGRLSRWVERQFGVTPGRGIWYVYLTEAVVMTGFIIWAVEMR